MRIFYLAASIFDNTERSVECHGALDIYAVIKVSMAVIEGQEGGRGE